MKKEKHKKIGKKTVFILGLKPYSQEVVVVCNGQFSDALNEIKKLKSKNAKEIVEYVEKNKEKFTDDRKIGGGDAFLYTTLPHGYVMMIDHLDNWIDTVGLVVHESLHLTHYILQRAGLTLTPESEEAYTYLTEETVESILEKIY